WTNNLDAAAIDA
ncbi:hypothetical protein ACOMHN_017732, partial [Nucella lapillus]